MIAPMLACPMSKADVRDWNDWMMEEKYDGWRLVVEVASHGVTAHTRARKHAGGAGKTQNTFPLPPHLAEEFSRLPVGTYDGELIVTLPDGHTGTSTDVSRVDLQDALRFVAFDVLNTRSGSCMMLPYTERRELLVLMFDLVVGALRHIELADARECVSTEHVAAFRDAIWEDGGEGLILKRKSARYHAGKRSPDFVKLKKLLTTVCTVIGFEATRGKVMNRGAFATVILEDAQGRQTSVKTKDDAELAKFNAQAANIEGTLDHVLRTHPAIGRRLRIEYQDIASDGGYRHPRWDRWEDE